MMISIKRAAKAIGCSPVTVQNWINEEAPIGAIKKMNDAHKMAWLVDKDKVFGFAILRGWELPELA